MPLLITRRKDQKIKITVPPSINETLIDVTYCGGPENCRLLFDAPLTTKILREELLSRDKNKGD